MECDVTYAGIPFCVTYTVSPREPDVGIFWPSVEVEKIEMRTKAGWQEVELPRAAADEIAELLQCEVC